MAAYGIADAEHLVEKELALLWPEATVVIGGISRIGPARIVEEFRIGYRIRGTVEVEADTPAEAVPAAFRALQQRTSGSRFERTVWEEE